MKKPNDYENTQPFGSFKVLPADGYVCTIKGVFEMESQSGKPMLKVPLDIAEGEYKGYFNDLYLSRKQRAKEGDTVKWSNDGVKYIMILDNQGRTSRDFRTFCDVLEDSGVQVWNADNDFLTKNIVGKQIGVVFGREETEYNGKRSWHTKPRYFIRLEDAREGNYNVPMDKALPEEAYDGFSATDDLDGLPF